MENKVHIIQCPPVWLKTPPLSLVYLKTYLESKGFNAKIMDLNSIVFQMFFVEPKNWLKLDKEFENTLFNTASELYPYLFENVYKQIRDSDYIGFSLFKRNAAFTFKLADKIKEKYPDKKI